MDPLPEKLVPRRLLTQCRFWDCRRFKMVQSQYCSLNHQMLSASEEALQRAVVVVDGFEMDERAKISQKILMAKAAHVHCGVPELPHHVLQGNPWQMAELNSNRIEHESARDWLFTSDNAPPGNIWQFYDNRKVAGTELRRIRYNLKPALEGAIYSVHQYSIEDGVLNASVFWIIFKEGPLAKQKAKRAITVSDKEPEPKKVCQSDIDQLNPPAELDKRKHLVQSPNSFSTVLQSDIDLLNPLAELETRKHKLKRLVQSPDYFFMDVKCQGCFNSTTVCSHSHTDVDVTCQGCFNIDVSHSQTVVVCGNCQTVLTFEMSKLLAVEELERLIEELKVNLDKAETEEKQANWDSELPKLRVEEMEQGIAGEASVATKALLEAAQARHTSAISERESVKEVLQTLQNEYDALVKEKELAVKETILVSKVVERKVEEMPRLLQHH